MQQLHDSMHGIGARIDQTTLDKAPSASKNLETVTALQIDAEIVKKGHFRAETSSASYPDESAV